MNVQISIHHYIFMLLMSVAISANMCQGLRMTKVIPITIIIGEVEPAVDTPLATGSATHQTPNHSIITDSAQVTQLQASERFPATGDKDHIYGMNSSVQNREISMGGNHRGGGKVSSPICEKWQQIPIRIGQKEMEAQVKKGLKNPAKVEEEVRKNYVELMERRRTLEAEEAKLSKVATQWKKALESQLEAKEKIAQAKNGCKNLEELEREAGKKRVELTEATRELDAQEERVKQAKAQLEKV